MQEGQRINPVYQFSSIFLWIPGLGTHLQYLFLLISNIQYLLIVLWIQMINIESRGNVVLTQAVDQIVKALLFLDHPNYRILMTSLYLYMALLACVMLYSCIKSKQTFTRTEKLFLIYFSQFHLSVGFWTCNALLIVSLTQAKKELAKGAHFNNAGFVSMHILLMLFNMGTGFIMSIFSYDPFRRSNLLASTTPIFQFLTFLFKCVISMLIAIDDKGKLAWLITLSGFSVSFLRYWKIIQKFPFYSLTATKLSLIFSSMDLLLLSICLLSLIFSTIQSEKVIYLDLLLLPLFAKYQVSLMQKAVSKYLSMNVKELKTRDDAFKKLFALESVLKSVTLQESYQVRDIEFLGVWEKNFEFTLENYKMRKRSCVKELLIQCLEKFQDSSRLKLYFAEFIASHEGENLILGLNYLHQATFRKKFNSIIATPLWRVYQDRLRRGQNQLFDFESYFEFEKSSKDFLKAIHNNIGEILNFWDAFKKPSLETLFLIEQSQRIEGKDMEIRDLYQKIAGISSPFLKELGLVYSTYLSSIRNVDSQANKIHSNCQRDQHGMISKDALIFTLSMQKEKFGEILYSSANITKVLGWDNKEAIGKSINFIFPEFLRKINTQLLKDTFASNQSLSEIYLLKKFGDLSPYLLETSIHPDIQHGIKCVALFKEKNEQFEQIIFNKNATAILGFTEKIGEFLSLKEEKDRTDNQKVDEMLPMQIKRKILESKEEQEILLRLKKTEFKAHLKYHHQNFWILSVEPNDLFLVDKKKLKLKSTKNTLQQPIRIFNFQEEEPFRNTTAHLQTISERYETVDALVSPKCTSDRASLLGLVDANLINKQNRNLQRAKTSKFSEQNITERQKVENALYTAIPKEPRIKILNLLSITFLLLTTGLLLGFQSQNTKVMNTLAANVEIVGTSLARLLRIINVYSLGLYQLSFAEGTMFLDRFGQWGVLNAKKLTLAQYGVTGAALLHYNTKLQKSIDRIEGGLTGFLFQKIPVLDSDGISSTNRSLNSFDFVTEIVAKAQRIKFKDSNQIYGNNDTDIAFITNNAIDGLLKVSEQSIFIVQQDCQNKIQNHLNLTVILMVLIGLLGLSLFSFFGYIVNVILRERRISLQILRRIELSDVSDYIKRVERFRSLLVSHDFSLQLISEEFDPAKFKDCFELQSPQIRKKQPANNKGLSQKLIQTILIAFALVLFLFSGYFSVFVLVFKQNQKISNKVDLMVNSNYHFYEISLIKTSMLRYLNGFTNMTLRSRPIIKNGKKFIGILTILILNLCKSLTETVA